MWKEQSTRGPRESRNPPTGPATRPKPAGSPLEAAGNPPELGGRHPGSVKPGIGRLEILEGAGHFAWKDVPDRYWAILQGFITSVKSGSEDPKLSPESCAGA